MGCKNDFLIRMQARAARNELMSNSETFAHVQQAMFDAIVITLGYGSCMGNNPWGEKRIQAFVDEVRDNFKKQVFPGIEVRKDSDGFRGEVDKLIAKKCPKTFEPWPERYVFWREETIEQEAERERKTKKRKK